MDINDLRAGFTVLSMLMFVGIAMWAYSKRNLHRFDEVAAVPLLDDDVPAEPKLSRRPE
ncbi:CcoQ/FixQ family Cbb3-type cytochrome c oxidase assembly chaperone [Paucibacter sediminis]|jgi:cytochrome c oxidase cbb3-type subunit 4|uniref:CcoQ/FixQ family Cbb3-type cytochrome c oxidase assembly chaperone n=1 Tax=Paucibacter sediminis TaxID=3019553 RepID=A0AA95NCH6_9BURK|nr:CcoQ/FixQ family Cbb3-type cytochrome c oxidase assembly chaperone [Paucibacter sp. S2-9]WIT11665.1 CcoQ/FixQ family Cbb3-type cytochrome c oxidase assembly chaperone [Paucibacter sp. S2-9]